MYLQIFQASFSMFRPCFHKLRSARTGFLLEQSCLAPELFLLEHFCEYRLWSLIHDVHSATDEVHQPYWNFRVLAKNWKENYVWFANICWTMHTPRSINRKIAWLKQISSSYVNTGRNGMDPSHEGWFLITLVFLLRQES